MSNYYYDYYDPGKYKFNYDNSFPSHTSSDSPPKFPKYQGRPFWFFGILSIFIVIWNIRLCIRFCRKKQTADAEAIYTNNCNHQMPRSMPVANMISENSRHASSSNYISNPLAARPPTTFIPSAPHVEYLQPQVFQPTAPRFIEDSTPKYDSPPNYDEAMRMIGQQKQVARSPTTTDARNLINESTFEQPTHNIHQTQDTNLQIL